jgi:hypothetical protein
MLVLALDLTKNKEALQDIIYGISACETAASAR